MIGSKLSKSYLGEINQLISLFHPPSPLPGAKRRVKVEMGGLDLNIVKITEYETNKKQ